MSDGGKWPQAIERDAHGQYKLMAAAAGWRWFSDAWNMQQARIDELMLEHCPSEMTQVQKAAWAAAQRVVEPSEASAVDRAAGLARQR